MPEHKDHPFVTVLLPVYNAQDYLREAIASVLSQTYPHFELLIINDGSTDNSVEIIRSFTDPHIRLVNNETNLKLIATLNKGFELARGKYIVRMDADDICLPKRLERQVAFMEKNEAVGICGSWFESFGTVTKVVKYPQRDEDIRIMMLYQTPFCHPSVIIRKELLDKNKIRFSTDFIHAEDYELWARVAGQTRFANIPEVLLRYRQHGESVSAAHRKTQEQNTIRIIQNYFRKTGVAMNELEVRLFRDIAYSHFTANKNILKASETLLIKLVEANRKSGFLPEVELHRFIADKWIHLCLNASSIGKEVYGIYFSSPLVQIAPVAFSLKAKLFIKSRLLARQAG